MTTPPCATCGYPVRRRGDTCRHCRRAGRWLLWALLLALGLLICDDIARRL